MVQVNSYSLHDFDWKYPVNRLGDSVLAKQLLEEGKEEGGRGDTL